MFNCVFFLSVYPIPASAWNTTQEQDEMPICLYFSILVKCIDFSIPKDLGLWLKKHPWNITFKWFYSSQKYHKFFQVAHKIKFYLAEQSHFFYLVGASLTFSVEASMSVTLFSVILSFHSS